MKTVLFACVHNAGRSQMAAALFNRLADPAKARAISAGTHPGAHVEAIAAPGMERDPAWETAEVRHRAAAIAFRRRSREAAVRRGGGPRRRPPQLTDPS
jgi:protein-tyrosine-phosphatase